MSSRTSFEKFIGRVTTDTELNALYEEMLRAAGVTLVNRIRLRFNPPYQQPSHGQRMYDAEKFTKKREALLRVCRQRNLVVPNSLSLLSCQRFILRQMLQ